MALDPSIYGMLQQQRSPSPFETAQQALTIKGLVDQNAMRPEMQRMAVQKQAQELEHQKATTNKTMADTHATNLKVSRDMLASAQTDADLMAFTQHIAKTYGPEVAQQLPKSVSDPGFEEFRQKRIMDADAMLKRSMPELQSVDTGGQIDRVNPYTNEVVATMPKTLTPDQRNKNETRTSKKGNLPIQALKLQQEELDAIGIGSTIASDLSAIKGMLDTGKLSLGPLENLNSEYKNWRGKSDENSRNFATFQSTLEKMRNDSLRLNKGVQTEGDAQRAWNEILKNVNDVPLVKKRLEEVEKINERAINLRKMNIDNIRSNYDSEPLDVQGYTNQSSPLAPKETPEANKGPTTFDAMPDPSTLAGKRIKGPDGTVYKSNGSKWVRQ